MLVWRLESGIARPIRYTGDLDQEKVSYLDTDESVPFVEPSYEETASLFDAHPIPDDYDKLEHVSGVIVLDLSL